MRGPFKSAENPPMIDGCQDNNDNNTSATPVAHERDAVVTDILKDVLSSYLQEEKYDAELCRQMTKTISEVVKARVKELMIPRYKLVVLISIGQLGDQSMYVGSRCLWDAANDTFATHAFKNASLLAVASVYAVYFE
ncbi:hypothetical protein NHX12_005060 [Muraenolepis orangiensis]|uniref:Tctex1 domain-containing protein 1 n=1 Tax=Muraenolepis orangiensis TaxID=630683 RepID=A0A9Q0E0B2_9TELE|nr:hypothetical protein NHX12_005060 [Muraenolepis orangiensis]